LSLSFVVSFGLRILTAINAPTAANTTTTAIAAIIVELKKLVDLLLAVPEDDEEPVVELVPVGAVEASEVGYGVVAGGVPCITGLNALIRSE
jgi:hypothetical protein